MALDDADTAGPLALAALVESPPHYTSEDSESAKTRIVLIGDSDFASNAFAEVPGNTVLFGNAVNWLAEEERLIAIGPKDARRDPVVFKTDVQRSVVFFINVLGIPGLILAAGITVWVVRRVALSQWSNAARRQDDETA